MQKNHIGKTLAIWIIVLFIGAVAAQGNVLIKNIKPSLEVVIDVTGSGKIFHITTFIKNNGDEEVTIMLICQPTIIRKSLRIFIVVVAGLYILDNILEQDVKTILAAAGIGGLAFALAAKDTLANFFGSVTIFADRPFQ